MQLVYPISGNIEPILFAQNDWLFAKNGFMNIKMKSNNISVATSFCHAY